MTTGLFKNDNRRSDRLLSVDIGHNNQFTNDLNNNAVSENPSSIFDNKNCHCR